MKTQHTPKAWLHEDYKVYPPATANMHVIGDSQHEIAYAYKDADARLIAAAPEMLEALKQTEKMIMGGDWKIMRQVIRAAIAKATGEK